MATKYFSDDEQVTLQVGSKVFETQVGTLRRFPDSKLSDLFPEDEPTTVPSEGYWFFDRKPEAFAVIMELLRNNKLVIPPGMSEATINEELRYWDIGPLDDLEILDSIEEEDTESDSPTSGKFSGIPSKIRVSVDEDMDTRLDLRYSMRADELFGRAIALVRQEDAIVKITDIQHGLALLRELLSVEKNNVSYMYYMAYGELRLGRTSEASYWVDRILRLDPANLAGASLRTLINDKRKQNSATGIILLGGAVATLGAVWWMTRSD